MGDKHNNFSVSNSLAGSTHLVKRILSALTSHSIDTILIGLKVTSVYGDHLVYFLRENTTLESFNRKNHLFNPKQVKKFKDTYHALSEMIMWTHLSLLTSCVSMKSTRRYNVTVATKPSRISHEHITLQSVILLKKNNAI